METTRLWSVQPYNGHYITHTLCPRFKYHARKESRKNIRMRRKGGCWENLCSRHMIADCCSHELMWLHSQELHDINLAKMLPLEEELLTKYQLYLRNYLQFTLSRRRRNSFLQPKPLVGSRILVVSHSIHIYWQHLRLHRYIVAF